MKGYLVRRTDTPLCASNEELLRRFRDGAQKSDLVWVSEVKEADIVVLFEEWSYKTWRYADELISSAFIRAHAQRILVINYDDAARGFLPGLYTSLSASLHDPTLYGAVCFPESINEVIEKSERPPTRVRVKWIGSFRGNPATSRVRAKLAEALRHAESYSISWVRKQLHYHSEAEKHAYAQEMQDSAFVLCPRGHSPGTYRVFEAMALARCPVIISDEWVPPCGPSWSEFSIRIAEKDIANIQDILNKRLGDAQELGARAHANWRRYFCPEVRFAQYIAALLDLEHNRRRLSLSDYKNLWSSRTFRRARGWTLAQRVAGRVRRLFPGS